MLGTVHVGKDSTVPFAFTTTEHPERVNLSLELPADRLELNVVGWRMAQAKKMQSWLRTYDAEKALRRLDDHQVVVYVRTAYKKSADAKPYWQREEVDELGSRAAKHYDALWLVKHSMNHYGKGTALAFHIRRSWNWAELVSHEDAVDTLTEEVRRLLPVVAEINGVATP